MPTFAVVSSSTRPSRRSAIARAAAAIAERPSSGIHAGVRGAPVEANLDRLRVRRAEDHVADRRRLVVHVAEPRLQALVVERGGAQQPDLLLRREQELDAAVRPVLGEDARAPPRASPRRRTCCRRRGSCRPALRTTPSSMTGSIAAVRRDGVEVRAEEDGVAAVASPRGGSRGCRCSSRLRAGVVFVDGQPEVAQVADDDVGDGALLARRARERRELGEEVDDLGGHRSIL